MSRFLIQFIIITLDVFVWLVIIKVILSYFMNPYHPVRETIDKVVEPLLTPIRRIIPPAGGLDFSPIVLLLLLQVVANFLSRL